MFLTQEVFNSLKIEKFVPRTSRFKTPIGSKTIIEICETLLELGILVKPSERGELLDEITTVWLAPKNVDRPEISNAVISQEELSLLQNNADERIVNLVPLMDYNTGKIVFFNSDLRKIELIDEEVFLSRSYAYENKKDLKRGAKVGVVGFYPLEPRALFPMSHDGTEFMAANIYNVPKWVTSTPTDTKNMPIRLKRLLENVFPDPDAREYALCWIFHAYMSRNHTYLCLIGAFGVGKGLLADLVGQLVGTEYYEKVGDAFLEERFNSQLDQSRFLFYDEVSIDNQEKINRMKQFANDSASFEKKGQDAVTIRNYSSGMVASNILDSVKIQPEERRFSIPPLGDRNFKDTLKEIFGDEDLAIAELQYMSEYLNRGGEEEPHEDVVNFGHWLLERYKNTPPKYNNVAPYKPKYFFDISFGSMEMWKQFLISYLRDNPSRKPVSIKTIAKAYEAMEGVTKFPMGPTINKFLFSYREAGEFKVGEVKPHVSSKIDGKPKSHIFLTEKFIEYRLAELKKSGVDYQDPADEEEIPEYDYRTMQAVDGTQVEEVDGAELL